jgi:hypothetical protein
MRGLVGVYTTKGRMATYKSPHVNMEKRRQTPGQALPQIPPNSFATHKVLLDAVSCLSLHLPFDIQIFTDCHGNVYQCPTNIR